MAALPLLTLFVLVPSEADTAKPPTDGPHVTIADVGDLRHPLPRVEKIILRRTNGLREQKELGTLGRDPKLDQAAQWFADFMARTGEYGHEADGREPDERIVSAGYERCATGENIAWLGAEGQRIKDSTLGSEFYTGWRDSPPHYENMVNGDFSEIGLGVARSDETGRYYAVQLFGRPSASQFPIELVNESGRQIDYIFDGRTVSLPSGGWRQHVVCSPVEVKVADLEPQAIAEPTRLVIEQTTDGLTANESGSPRELPEDADLSRL